MARIALLTLMVLVTLLFIDLHSAKAIAPKADEGSSVFEDQPERLEPKRDESQVDRIQAAALFAEGRLLFRRQDFAEALRKYQRAWRSDPDSAAILREIVDLGFSLRRSEEAARYAVILAEKSPSDPTFMRRLAMHLTRLDEPDRAAALYEKSFDLEKDRPIRGDDVLVRLEAGRLFLLNGDYEKSADLFGLVVEALNKPEAYGLTDEMRKAILDKEDQTYAMFGEAFRMAGRYDDAVGMFNKSHEVKADEGLLELRLARIAEKKDEIDDALAHIEKAFAKKVETASGQQYALLSDLLKKKAKDEAEAKKQLISRLEKLYAENSTDLLLGYYLADLYRESNQLESAESIYRKQLDVKPSLDGFSGLIDIYTRLKDAGKLTKALGETLVEAGTFQQLDEVIDKLIADEKLVDDYLNSILKAGSADAKGLGDGIALAAAVIALKAEKVDLGTKLFEMALAAEKPDKQRTVSTWGLELFMADKYEPAAAVFRRGFEDGALPKDNPDFHFYLAGALEMAGKTDDALKAAKEAAKLRPKETRYQSRVPWVIYHAKRYDEAEKRYRELLNKFDSDYRTMGVRESMREARFVLSNICVHQERTAEAEEWLEEVLDEFPENIGAMNDLGYLWADEGKNLQRAFGMIQKAVKAEPENIAYLDSLGWILYRLGRYDDAVRELEKAVVGDEPDAIILDHLADAYLKAKKKEKAVETWRRALKRLDEGEAKKRNEIELKLKEHTAE